MCGQDPLAALRLHDERLPVTGALFLQQDVLVQSYFPGRVPGVSLLPPTSFLQFCGYLWVCAVPCGSAEPQPALENG